LPAEAVAWRVQQLRAAGAKEVRFVDPTFNARTDFTQLLELLVTINPDRKLGFFAELRADTLTPEQANLLAQSNFLDIEVGVQSTDPTDSENNTPIRASGKPTPGFWLACWGYAA